MSDVVLIFVAAIAALGSVFAATISGLALVQSRSTHTLINSRMDDLPEQARELAYAKGAAESAAEHASDR